jgi:hypothetical protein
VIHLWDAPDVVRWYLETGDETIRDAAVDAVDPAKGNLNVCLEEMVEAVRAEMAPHECGA